MKRFFTILLLFVLTTIIAFSQIPFQVNYQGVLTDGAGDPVTDGTYDLTFNLYTLQTGGAAIWTNTFASVPTESGVFGVTLTGGSPDLSTIDFTQQYWIGVSVNGGSELSPRIALTSSPYSIRTKSIEVTDAAGQNIISSINSATSGTVNDTRLSSTVVLDSENPNAAGDIDGNFSTGLTIGATDATGQNIITSINSATSGTVNGARLSSTVVLDSENPNAAGDIGGNFSTGLTIGATDATGQNIITSINSATSGTVNGARLSSTVVLDSENPNAAGDIDGNFSTGLTIENNSVGANELNVSGNGTSGQILSSNGDGSFSWADDQTGGGGAFGKAVKSSAETKTDATLADDNTLSISWGAEAGTYRVTLHFAFSDGGDGINVRLERLGSGTPTFDFFPNFPAFSTNSTYTLSGFCCGNYGFITEGILVVPNTITGVKLRWSKNTDNTTDTQILKGILTYEKLE